MLESDGNGGHLTTKEMGLLEMGLPDQETPILVGEKGRTLTYKISKQLGTGGNDGFTMT